MAESSDREQATTDRQGSEYARLPAECADEGIVESNPFELRTPIVFGGVIASCPRCGKVLDLGIRIYGGLGPSLIECPRCDGVTLSHRQEWADMTWIARLRFICLSFYYVLFGAISGFILATLAYQWDGVQIRREADLPQASALFWAVFVAGAQIYRILRSRSRTRCDSRQSDRPTLLNPDFGLQWKLIVLQIGVSILLAILLWVSRI